MNKKASIVILGAGPCGLSTAWGLVEKGFSNVVLLERNNVVGGMVRSEIINNNSYEYGAHYFHSDDKEIVDKILNLLDGSYSSNKRNLMIKFNGKYFQYPLKVNDLIGGFNPAELFLLLVSMLYSLIKNNIFPKDAVTAEDVLIGKYGRRLYRKFFEGYITDFWSVHPSGLSASFAKRRISRLDALDALKKLFSAFRIGKTSGRPDEFIEVVKGDLYYPHAGMHKIWDAMVSRIIRNGCRILTGVSIKSISSDGLNMVKSVLFENGKTEEKIDADMVISTIPINSFLGYVNNVNREVLDISSRLKYRSLIIVGLLVSKEKILPSYCTYYHNRIFSRASEPKQAGLTVNPAKHTILLLEISCNFQDDIWNNPQKLLENIYGELKEENLLAEEDVKEVHILKERFAYPVFDLNYERNMEQVRAYLATFMNVFSTGRQGIFQYVNAHVAIKMGFLISEMIEKYNCIGSKPLNTTLYL